MLLASLLFDPRGIYLSGSLPCGLRYYNLRHPSLARVPANSLTMLCRCDSSHRLLVPAVHDRVPLPAFRGRRRAAGLGRPCALFRWRRGCRRHPRHPSYCGCETPLQHWSKQCR
jgi:hypothetical protein